MGELHTLFSCFYDDQMIQTGVKLLKRLMSHVLKSTLKTIVYLSAGLPVALTKNYMEINVLTF